MSVDLWVPCPDGKLWDNPIECETCDGLMFVPYELLTDAWGKVPPKVKRKLFDSGIGELRPLIDLLDALASEADYDWKRKVIGATSVAGGMEPIYEGNTE